MENQPDLQQMQTGKQLVVFGHLFNLLMTGEETGGRYFIYEDLVPPGGGPPPHTHPDEELFYIIEGEFQFILDDMDKPFRVFPGQLVKIPPMALHTFRNVGGKMGRTLTMLLPGDLEKYFRAVGTLVESQADIPDLSKAPDFQNMDLAKAFRLAPEHNVEFVFPKDVIGVID